MDIDLVERVEVVRGPGHTLYGDNAFLAVINVIPKKGAAIRGLETSAGLFNLFDTRYADPVSADFRQDAIEQDGRRFRVKVSYRF